MEELIDVQHFDPTPRTAGRKFNMFIDHSGNKNGARWKHVLDSIDAEPHHKARIVYSDMGHFATVESMNGTVLDTQTGCSKNTLTYDASHLGLLRKGSDDDLNIWTTTNIWRFLRDSHEARESCAHVWITNNRRADLVRDHAIALLVAASPPHTPPQQQQQALPSPLLPPPPIPPPPPPVVYVQANDAEDTEDVIDANTSNDPLPKRKNKQIERIVQCVEAWRQANDLGAMARVTREYPVTCPRSGTLKNIDIHAEGDVLPLNTAHCTEVKTGSNAAGFSHAIGEVLEKTQIIMRNHKTVQNVPVPNISKQVCLFYEYPADQDVSAALNDTKMAENCARKENSAAWHVTLLPSYKVSVEWDAESRPIWNHRFCVHRFDVNDMGQETFCEPIDVHSITQWQQVNWQMCMI